MLRPVDELFLTLLQVERRANSHLVYEQRYRMRQVIWGAHDNIVQTLRTRLIRKHQRLSQWRWARRAGWRRKNYGGTLRFHIEQRRFRLWCTAFTPEVQRLWFEPPEAATQRSQFVCIAIDCGAFWRRTQSRVSSLP